MLEHAVMGLNQRLQRHQQISIFQSRTDDCQLRGHLHRLGLSHTVDRVQTPSTGLPQPSFKEGAGKRCSECVPRGETGPQTPAHVVQLWPLYK